MRLPHNEAPSSRLAGGASAHDDKIHNIHELRQALIDAGPQLVAYVIGAQQNARLSSRRQLRWGRKGSFSYEVTGRNRGLWRDYEAGDRGDLLELIRTRILSNANFPDVVRWARQWLGWPVEGPVPVTTPIGERLRQEAERVAKAEAQAAEDKRRRVARALSIWQRSRPVEGTPAATYLRRTRCIPIRKWPEALRFDPLEGALVVAATDDAGALVAVQSIRLTPEGCKVEDDAPVKISRGLVTGAAVRLPGAAEGPVLVAEGPETGLTAWAATGHETLIALGSMTKVTLPAGRQIVVCRDDDPQGAPAWQATRKAVRAWRDAGHDVETVSPWPEPRGDRSDLNDVIRAHGPAAVRERIERALAPSTMIGRRLVPLEQARETLDHRVGEWAQEALGWDGEGDPPVHAIAVSLGGGKTETALRHAAKMLTTLRARGDRRALAMAVPTHNLSGEVAKRAREILPDGLKVAIWRGREAKQPDGTDSMCGNIDEVREAQKVYADIEQDVCQTCPRRDGCAYLEQRDKSGDLWLLAHPLIYGEAPAAVQRQGLAALIVDESALQAGLVGVEGRGIEVRLDMLEHGAMPVPPGTGPDGGARLDDLRLRLKDAIEVEPDGWVRRDALTAAGFVQDSGSVAGRLEWRRKVTDGPWRARKANETLGRMALLWQAVEDVLRPGGPERSGRLKLGRNEDGARALRVTGRRAVGAAWQVPTLLIDATFDEDLARPFWPQLKVTGRIDIDAPHMKVRQVAGRSFAKSYLVPLIAPVGAEAEATDRSRAKARTKVEAMIARIDRERDGRTLVISNKPVSEALKLPAHIERAHFNAVAGRDEWRDVNTIVLVGRTQPPAHDVERMAGALTGAAPIPITTGQYPRVPVQRAVRSGNGLRLVADEAPAHPDPIAERIRQRICEGELMQALGRARGVNRTAADPVEALILTDVVLPVPVNELVPEGMIAPGPEDLQLGQGGIAFEDGSAAAQAYPGLWPSAGAARTAMHRTSVTNPYREPLIGECNGGRLVRVAYRIARHGARLAYAIVDLKVVLDPRRAIEQALGPLDQFSILTAEADADDQAVNVEAAPDVVPEVIPPPAPAPDPVSNVVDLHAIRAAIRDGLLLLRDVAASVGVSQPHLSNAIHGRRTLRPAVHDRLAALVAQVEPRQGRLL